MPTNLRQIRAFPELVRYLEEQLDWPLQEYGFDELTFEYSPGELGLKEEDAANIKSINQLRPLASGQPWGIFFVEFENKKLPVVVLRRILSHLALKKRASANKASAPAWHAEDLLFITAFGEDNTDAREIAFAHFHQNPGDMPTLHVLGWDGGDTPLKLANVDHVLRERLHWPADEKDTQAWRETWSKPFRHRIGHVITTASLLAEELASLARGIRDKAKLLLAAESEKGEITKLYKAFQTALIHDLTPDSFADTYAQTITYGLLTAAISRTDKYEGGGTALIAENVVDMVPITNPFLKEMLQTFLKVGGRKGGIDFDELGIQDVVELLRDEKKTDLHAILRDFGNKTRGEDPVIHFYEHFLSAYNKKLKIQRGVFYTPQPVVSYIVRSVHELLQTEFGLEDGLASTITWGEMAARKLPSPLAGEGQGERGGFTIPEGTSPDEPFVVILDPATGTATFLVEVINVIHRTLTEKWTKQGMNPAQRLEAWNDYVPKHLLPRLYGYELMMAPYAIAHMKIGLKLAETGYRFASNERVRIYLTNALEPWQRQLKLPDFEALAHEAVAVNEVKRDKRFTVIVGNPPYSEKSKNEGAWINVLMERYKTTIRSEEAQIKTVSNDYIKFLCFIQHTADLSEKSIVGLITSNGYLDGRLFRDLRNAWLSSFERTDVLNLHGSGRRGDAALDDENVFDILQGVSIAVARRSNGVQPHEVRYAEMLGRRTHKYDRLSKECVINGVLLAPREPLFLFTPSIAAQTSVPTWPLSAIFGTGNPSKDRNKTYAGGFKTRQDSFTVAFDEHTLRVRIAELADDSISESQLRKTYSLCSTAHFEFDKARRAAQSGALARGICRIRYRPFDDRPMIWSREVLCEPQTEVTRHLLRTNLCLATSRVIKDDAFRHVAVARGPVEVISLSTSTSTNAYMFPLYRYEAGHLFSGGGDKEGKVVNLSRRFIAEMMKITGLEWDESDLDSDRSDLMTPEDIFSYLYALLHSPIYRAVFADELLRDFPPIPFPSGRKVFRTLSRLGGELVALHLLESPKLDQPITEFIGSENPGVEKPSWSDNTVWVDKAQTTGFKGVREEVWNFHIGGYQVCQKWLKDRKGRTLTQDDIVHYQKIVIALSETIRLMAEIDKVIEQHGGWPGAFQASVDEVTK